MLRSASQTRLLALCVHFQVKTAFPRLRVPAFPLSPHPPPFPPARVSGYGSKLFRGRVTEVVDVKEGSKTRSYFNIKYSDGDSEDITRKELLSILVPNGKPAESTKRAREAEERPPAVPPSLVILQARAGPSVERAKAPQRAPEPRQQQEQQQEPEPKVRECTPPIFWQMSFLHHMLCHVPPFTRLSFLLPP